LHQVAHAANARTYLFHQVDTGKKPED
jgi:hypothetical protein